MKGKIVLVILIGLFIGLGVTYKIYDNVPNETKEELLTWDLYKENIDTLNIFINSYDPNIEYYGIYDKDEISYENLGTEDKVRIIYDYINNIDLIKNSLISYDSFNKISNKLFNETINFEEVQINENVLLKKNDNHNRYDVYEKSNISESNYSILNNGIKGAYKYGSLIYFDVKVTFVLEINNLYKYSLNPKFDNILCEGNNCKRKIKSSIYRITFEENNGSYFFKSSTRLGSE